MKAKVHLTRDRIQLKNDRAYSVRFVTEADAHCALPPNRMLSLSAGIFILRNVLNLNNIFRKLEMFETAEWGGALHIQKESCRENIFFCGAARLWRRSLSYNFFVLRNQ